MGRAAPAAPSTAPRPPSVEGAPRAAFWFWYVIGPCGAVAEARRGTLPMVNNRGRLGLSWPFLGGNMEMEMPSANRVDTIRETLEGMKGQRVRVRANMGRSRIVERTGTLVAAHPSLFLVEVEERRGRSARQSYQYVDVLTGTVELFDADSGERLFDFVAPEGGE